MFQTFEEALAFIQERSIMQVDLKFSDLWGRWHHVTVPVGHLRSAGASGGSWGCPPWRARGPTLTPTPGPTPWPVPARVDSPAYGVNVHLWWDEGRAAA